MFGTSDGMVYDDEYHYQAASMDGGSSNPFSLGVPEDNSSYNPLDPESDQTRPDPALGDQIPFILHPGQDILERPGLEPSYKTAIDPNMPNLGKGASDPGSGELRSEQNLFYPSPFNSIQQIAMKNENPNVSSDSTLDKEAFSSRFKGTVLADKADAVDMSAKKYGVPADLAASIMAHETGNGKSQQVQKYNNPAGMMHGNQPMLFKDINEGIDHAVRNIAHQWQNAGKSLEGLQKIYAPVGAANDPKGLNKDWLPGVSKIMKSLGIRVPSDDEPP